MAIVTRPLDPNDVSTDPSALYRATSGTPAGVLPATTILSSPWTTTPDAVNGRLIVPVPLPKVVSTDPSWFSRSRLGPPTRIDPLFSTVTFVAAKLTVWGLNVESGWPWGVSRWSWVDPVDPTVYVPPTTTRSSGWTAEIVVRATALAGGAIDSVPYRFQLGSRTPLDIRVRRSTLSMRAGPPRGATVAGRRWERRWERRDEDRADMVSPTVDAATAPARAVSFSRRQS